MTIKNTIYNKNYLTFNNIKVKYCTHSGNIVIDSDYEKLNIKKFIIYKEKYLILSILNNTAYILNMYDFEETSIVFNKDFKNNCTFRDFLVLKNCKIYKLYGTSLIVNNGKSLSLRKYGYIVQGSNVTSSHIKYHYTLVNKTNILIK